MKRVFVERFGGPELVTVVDEADPRPGPGEVRVKVVAAGGRSPTPRYMRALTWAAPSRRSRRGTSSSASSRS